MAGVRRGVLGGTFDPIHNGHLAIAEAARSALGLDEVLLVPAGEPWMRAGEALAAKEARWQMVVRAAAAGPWLIPSRVDLDRAGPTYAVDTLGDLGGDKPGLATYFFIMGADALRGLPQWREPDRLLRLCRIAAVSRPGHKAAEIVKQVAASLPALRGRVDIVPMEETNVSATAIRRLCREGASIEGLVPPAVERYIMERGLYQGAVFDTR